MTYISNAIMSNKDLTRTFTAMYDNISHGIFEDIDPINVARCVYKIIDPNSITYEGYNITSTNSNNKNKINIIESINDNEKNHWIYMIITDKLLSSTCFMKYRINIELIASFNINENDNDNFDERILITI